MKKIFVFLILAVILNSGCTEAEDEPVSRIYTVQYMTLPDGFSVTQPYLTLFYDKFNAETFACMVIENQTDTMLQSVSMLSDISDNITLSTDIIMCVRHYLGGYTYITKDNTVYHEDDSENMTFEIDLSDLFDSDTRYDTVTAMLLSSDENIYIASGNKIVLLDTIGNILLSLTSEKYFKTLACSNDDEIVAGLSEDVRDQGYTEIRYIDEVSRAWGEAISVPVELKTGTQTLFTGKGYDIYYSDSNCIYGLNKGSDPVELLEWYTLSNLNANIAAITAVSPDKFVCLIRKADGTYNPVVLTLEETMYYSNHENVVVATMGLHPYNSIDIMNFNSMFSQKINIQVKDYSKHIVNGDDRQAYTMLYNDIIAGENIDVINMGWYSDGYKTLTRKGAFCDHYEFLDTSSEMNRDSLMEYVKTPFEYNGELPLISTMGVSFETLTCKTEVLNGIEDGMTAEELINLSESLGEDQQLFLSLSGETLLRNTGRVGYTDFVDYTTSTCSFDGDTFVNFLKLALKLNDTEPLENDASLFREDKVIFADSAAGFNSYNSFISYMKLRNTFGDDEDITITGYPSAEGNGISVTFSGAYAILKSSEVKESAWRFIECLLSDEAAASQQNKENFMDTSIPSTTSMMKKYEADIVGGFCAFPLSDDGYLSYSSRPNVDIYGMDEYLSDPNYRVHVISQEDFDKYRQFLCSVTTPVLYDEKLVSIVTEEASAMFAGAKTAEETAKLIQSRASIYLSESETTGNQ